MRFCFFIRPLVVEYPSQDHAGHAELRRVSSIVHCHGWARLCHSRTILAIDGGYAAQPLLCRGGGYQCTRNLEHVLPGSATVVPFVPWRGALTRECGVGFGLAEFHGTTWFCNLMLGGFVS